MKFILHIKANANVMCIILGETADTLNALKYCKPRGALCVGITNTGEYGVYVCVHVCILWHVGHNNTTQLVINHLTTAA